MRSHWIQEEPWCICFPASYCFAGLAPDLTVCHVSFTSRMGIKSNAWFNWSGTLRTYPCCEETLAHNRNLLGLLAEEQLPTPKYPPILLSTPPVPSPKSLSTQHQITTGVRQLNLHFRHFFSPLQLSHPPEDSPFCLSNKHFSSI